MKENRRYNVSYDAKLLQPGLVGQMVQEKSKEETLVIFENSQTAGFVPRAVVSLQYMILVTLNLI